MSRQPNQEWDLLDELFGPTRTTQEAKRRGLCIKELRSANATLEEIRVTYDYCHRRFTTFTEMALLNHLSAATTEHKRSNVDGFLDSILGPRDERPT